MSLAIVQSYHDRSLMLFWVLPVNSMAKRTVSEVVKMRPSAAMSWMRSPPGAERTLRRRPDGVTAHSAPAVPPLSLAVYQSSSSLNDLARPSSIDHYLLDGRRRPFRSVASP